MRIVYNPRDLRYIYLLGPEVHTIEAHFNKIPQYQFLPSFRGIPRPEVFIHRGKLKSGETIFYAHSGLWKNIVDFCTENKIVVEGIDNNFKYRDFDVEYEDFKQYVLDWKLKYEPREYQITAAWLILKYRQSTSQLATRAGKTLLAYIVFRYMLEKQGAKKILMIVPNISLVKQAVGDMSEYAEFFTSETVWAKGELCESANLTVGTFQSLVNRLDKTSKKYNSKFFNDYDVVCVDEVHTAKCKSINTILGQDFMKNVKLKFGFSGSLPEADTIDSYICQSLIGPKVQDIRSRELMDDGYIAEAEIKQIRIHYNDRETLEDYIKCGEYLCSNDVVVDKKVVLLPKEQREFTIQHQKTLPVVLKIQKPLLSKEEYRDYLIDLCKATGSNLLLLEQMLVHRSKKRLDVIEKLLRSFDKNCIVFAHHTEYLNYLEKYYKEKLPEKNIYKITGATAQKKREQIIQALLDNNNCILFASYGCVGTGLTLKNIDYGIFAQSFKSQIINKQALGRGLCLAGDKTKYILYDVIDCFPSNKLFIQGKSKVKLFNNEQIPIEIQDV